MAKKRQTGQDLLDQYLQDSGYAAMKNNADIERPQEHTQSVGRNTSKNGQALLDEYLQNGGGRNVKNREFNPNYRTMTRAMYESAYERYKRAAEAQERYSRAAEAVGSSPVGGYLMAMQQRQPQGRAAKTVEHDQQSGYRRTREVKSAQAQPTIEHDQQSGYLRTLRMKGSAEYLTQSQENPAWETVRQDQARGGKRTQYELQRQIEQLEKARDYALSMQAGDPEGLPELRGAYEAVNAGRTKPMTLTEMDEALREMKVRKQNAATLANEAMTAQELERKKDAIYALAFYPEEWTPEQKQAARDILETQRGGSGIFGGMDRAPYAFAPYIEAVRSGDMDRADEWEQIYNMLYSRLFEKTTAVTEGFAEGLGLRSAEKVIGAVTGAENPAWEAYMRSVQVAKAQNPALSAGGQIAGSLALMGGISKGVGAASGALLGTKAAQLGTLGRTALSMGQSALTFAAREAIQGAGAAATGEKTGGAYAQDILASGAGGAAGALVSGLISTNMADWLRRTGNSKLFWEFVRQSASAYAFSGTSVATSAMLGSEKKSANEIATELGTAFLFSLVSGYMNTMRETKMASAAVEQKYETISQQLDAIGKHLDGGRKFRTEEEFTQAVEDLRRTVQGLKADVQGTYYAGQQDFVNQMVAALDRIDYNLLSMLPGADAGTAAASAASTAAAGTGGVAAAEAQKLMQEASAALAEGTQGVPPAPVQTGDAGGKGAAAAAQALTEGMTPEQTQKRIQDAFGTTAAEQAVQVPPAQPTMPVPPDVAAEAEAAQREANFQAYSRYAEERDRLEQTRRGLEAERSTVQYGQQEDGSRNGEGRTESVYSGGQSRGMGEGSEIERTLERQGEAVRLRNRAKDLGAENISPAEAGLKGGDTTKSLLKVPEAAYGAHEKELQKAVEARGASLNIVMGRIRLANGTAVDEFIDTETRQVTVRADCTKWAMDNLIDHALFHGLSTEQRNATAQAVADRFSESELMAIAGQYVKRMRGVYEGMSEDELLNTAMEEVLADAAGRMLRYTDADATKFTETVRGIIDWNGKTDAGEGSQRFSYAGEFARTADKETLERAKQMLEGGASAEDIFRETGWFKGADGQWRFEIDDSKMEFRRDGDVRLMEEEPYRRMQELSDKWAASFEKGGEELTEAESAELEALQDQYVDRVWEEKYELQDFLKHDDLYRAYPKLRHMSLIFRPMSIEDYGYYSPKDGAIVMNSALIGAPEKTLIHEIQHIIQSMEGFARGASPKYWNDRMEEGFSKKNAAGEEMLPNELYRNTAGEIEARDVAARRNMSADERRARMPDTGNADTVFAEGDGYFDMSVKTASDGTHYVLVENKMTNAQLSNYQAVADYIADHIGEAYTILESGQRVYIGEDLPNEYTQSRYTKKILQTSKLTAKNKAVSNLGEMIEIANNRRWEKTRHAENKDAPYGMYRYDTTFAFPVQGGARYKAFDAELVIRNASDGKKYLYDIVSIKENTGLALDLNNKARGRRGSGATRSDVSMDSIRGKSANVKQRYSPADTETETSAEKAKRTAAEGTPIFNFDAKYDFAYGADPNPFYRMIGITPPGLRIGIEAQATRAADKIENGKAYAKALLDFATKPDRSTKTLTLNFPNEDGTYRSENVQNTKIMQDIYKYYAEAVPEENRHSEAEFWMWRRRIAEGSVSSRIETMSAEAKAQAWQESARADFKSTGALEKMGVKVERSIGRYGRTQSLIETEKAYKQAKREVNRAIDRLAATPKEIAFARQIADGVFDMRDIPRGYDRRVVLSLVDYMNAEAALGNDRILAQRKAIRQETADTVEALFSDSADNKVSGMFTLNHRTAQRNMLHIFGDETGKKLNRAIFDPIQRNEAERIRFINKQFDDVRTFEDSTGKKSELTHVESILVQLVMEGKATVALLGDMPGSPAISKAGMKIADGMKPNAAAKSEHLNKNEKQLAKMYASWVSALRMMADGKIDTVKIDNAAKVYTQKYNEFYAAINDFLVAHGYEPIGFIQNYAPHMQAEETRTALDSALKMLGINEDVVTLPTSIAGLTADFKPNKRWNPYFLHRTGETYNFDVAKGFESYVAYMSELFYHTDDIMTVRALSDYLRRRYSPDDISFDIDKYTWLRERMPDEQLLYLQQRGKLEHGAIVDSEQLDSMIDDELTALYENAKNKSKYSNLVVWLDNYANVLAGKQTKGDRSTEEDFGRKTLTIGNKLTRGFGAAKVAGNIATIFNQTAQIPTILAEKGLRNTAAAIKDMATGQLRKTDFALESDYLTSKKGVHFLVTDEKNMYEWALDKVGQAQEFADATVATIAVRAAYLEGIRNGMTHKQAMSYADRYGAQVMGDRSKGAKPVAFNSKNPVMQLINTFQLEVANSWEHVTQDTAGFDFREMEKKFGKDKAVKALAGIIVKFLVATYIWNRIADEIYGGTPAPYDVLGITSNFIAGGYGLSINDAMKTVMDNGWEKVTGERIFGTEDKKRSFDGWRAIEAAGGDIANDIPYLQNASALIGWGDNTLPAAIPTKALDNMINAVKGGKGVKDIAKAAFDVGTEITPGGSQIKKTARGIDAMVRGGVYQGYGDQAKLRYPVDNKNIGKWIQAVVFGPNGLSETGRYYAGEERAIGEKQTVAYQAMIAAGADKEESYRLIRRIAKLGDGEDSKLDKLNMLLSSKVPTAGQGAYYYVMMAGDKERERIDELTGGDGVIGMDDYLMAAQKKLQIDADEAMRPTEKADAFRQWVNQKGYSAEQKRGILDAFKFSQIIMVGGGHSELYQAALEGVSEYDTLRADAIAAEKEGGKSQSQAESSVNSSLRSQMKQDYLDGLVDDETASQFLKEYTGADDDDVFWTMESWKGGDDWKKYGKFFDAVEKGVTADTRKVAKYYMEHGVDKGTLSSQLTEYFKERWLAASGDEAARLKRAYISAYKAIGGDGDKARDNMIKWRQEANKKRRENK